VLYTGQATQVLCRTVGGGDIAFLTDHAPMIGALDIWAVKITTTDNHEQWFAVHGGFVEVSHNRVIILSDVAELPPDIDVARAEAAKARAEEALRADPEDTAAIADGLADVCSRLRSREPSRRHNAHYRGRQPLPPWNVNHHRTDT
jgi:F-type H+-transporting ATPase subunit epsilon